VVAGLEDPAVGELGTFNSGDGDELVGQAVGDVSGAAFVGGGLMAQAPRRADAHKTSAPRRPTAIPQRSHIYPVPDVSVAVSVRTCGSSAIFCQILRDIPVVSDSRPSTVASTVWSVVFSANRAAVLLTRLNSSEQ
jgi:hypothetical protein